ncbi:helix-turn-helix domain-containing protein [Methylobacterium komagatae]
MALIDCGAGGDGLSRDAMDNEPWQKRAKRAGLSQKELARLLGVAENTVSLQLRGRWQSGTPRYVKTLIRAWEMLSQAQREALMDGADDE